MKPFTIEVPGAVLSDLRARLVRTRWPDEVVDAGWDYGTNLAYMRELVAYWIEHYDWRAQERVLNRIPQFLAKVGGRDIHFVHIRSNAPGALPLVITHGWPSSFQEMVRILGPLTDPERHGGDPADAFDVVVPSLPGFGFSERPANRGFVRVDRLWRQLMVDVLGYERFAAHGSDVGARVTSALGRHHPDVVIGIHIGSVDLDWPDPMPAVDELSEAELQYIERVRQWEIAEGGYDAIQSTRPQTLAYGLHDSPVGLAAWIIEKFRAWSDCGGEIERCFSKDELLTNIMIYWVTETIHSSMRRYFEHRNDPLSHKTEPGSRVTVPTGVAMFPGERELVVPREWAERVYEIHRWSEPAAGGHFPAVEQPDVLVEEIREFFRPLRRRASDEEEVTFNE